MADPSRPSGAGVEEDKPAEVKVAEGQMVGIDLEILKSVIKKLPELLGKQLENEARAKKTRDEQAGRKRCHSESDDTDDWDNNRPRRGRKHRDKDMAKSGKGHGKGKGKGFGKGKGLSFHDEMLLRYAKEACDHNCQYILQQAVKAAE